MAVTRDASDVVVTTPYIRERAEVEASVN